MQQEEIEIQLWEYIDGNCTAEEQARISGLIANDTMWKACYNELMSFDNSLKAKMVPERSAAAFTEKVMGSIEVSAKRYEARKRMLNLCIRAIGAFFIVLVVSSLIYALKDAQILATPSPEYRLPEMQIPDVQLPTYAPFIAGLLAVIILLAAGDKILRGKTTHRA